MDRESAFELLKQHVKDEKMRIHCLASEAVMRALAQRLGEDADKWGLAGLLHDIDVEVTNADPERHALEARNILKDYSLDPEIIDAITMHNEKASKKERSTLFQHALAAGETVTGLVYATALVYPDRKIASVKPKSVVKRMKEKAFAASVNRDHIMECEKIGVPLPEFAELAVNAMKEISDDIGL
ncbi:MAG: HDIG domain-containing protein [Marinilabiliales bacterium]|nr:MAG: HDIG domain-containing protein [Marinilabiliales bacterium]